MLRNNAAMIRQRLTGGDRPLYLESAAVERALIPYRLLQILIFISCPDSLLRGG